MDFDAIQMVPTGVVPPTDGSLYAVMQGELKLMGATLRVYQLSDGQRVFDASDVKNFFGFDVEDRA
jgi:hypothetical protein